MAKVKRLVAIYAITCVPNGHRYIGSSVHVERRWQRHREDLQAARHHCRALQRAWTKHGADAFTWEVLEPIEDRTRLRTVEREWIARLRPAYNGLVTEDESPLAHSAETRTRMRLAQLAIWERRRQAGTDRLSAEHRAAIAASHVGIRPTEATRAKLSAAKRQPNATAHLQTPEVKAKAGRTQRGVPKSDAHRAALKAAHRACRCHANTKQRPFEPHQRIGEGDA